MLCFVLFFSFLLCLCLSAVDETILQLLTREKVIVKYIAYCIRVILEGIWIEGECNQIILHHPQAQLRNVLTFSSSKKDLFNYKKLILLKVDYYRSQQKINNQLTAN